MSMPELKTGHAGLDIVYVELGRARQELTSLRAELVRVTRQRDGLIADLRNKHHLTFNLDSALLRAKRAEGQLEALAGEADRKLG